MSGRADSTAAPAPPAELAELQAFLAVALRGETPIPDDPALAATTRVHVAGNDRVSPEEQADIYREPVLAPPPGIPDRGLSRSPRPRGRAGLRGAGPRLPRRAPAPHGLPARAGRRPRALRRAVGRLPARAARGRARDAALRAVLHRSVRRRRAAPARRGQAPGHPRRRLGARPDRAPPAAGAAPPGAPHAPLPARRRRWT